MFSLPSPRSLAGWAVHPFRSSYANADFTSSQKRPSSPFFLPAGSVDPTLRQSAEIRPEEKAGLFERGGFGTVEQIRGGPTGSLRIDSRMSWAFAGADFGFWQGATREHSHRSGTEEQHRQKPKAAQPGGAGRHRAICGVARRLQPEGDAPSSCLASGPVALPPNAHLILEAILSSSISNILNSGRGVAGLPFPFPGDAMSAGRRRIERVIHGEAADRRRHRDENRGGPLA
jgi:hypothetical protein